MTKDMTEGSPMSLILKFSLPLLAANLLQQVYSLVDAAIVGQTMGADALGAVGATSSVQFLVIGFCTGACVGFGIPVAQKFGAHDEKTMRSFIFHGAVWAIVIAIIATMLTTIGCNGILYILQTPDDIYEMTYNYIFIIFVGIPFTILYNFLASMLRAVGDSRTPFLFVILSSGINIVLDLVFIINLHLGVNGAATATVISQAVSGILCLVTILRKFPVLHLSKEDRVWRKDVSGTSIGMGLPTGFQMSIIAIGSMVMQSANNSLGTLYVSGFATGTKIKGLALAPFDAFATGTSTFVSQNYGAGNVKRIKFGIRDGMIIGTLYGIGMGLFLFFGGYSFSTLFIGAEEVTVLEESAKYLRCMGYFFCMLGILVVSRTTIQGLGHAGLSVFSGIIEMIARSVTAIIFVPKFGYSAICWTDQTAWCTAAVYSTITLYILVKKMEKNLSGDHATHTLKKD